MSYLIFIIMILILILQTIKVAFDFFQINIKKIKLIADIFAFIISIILCFYFDKIQDLNIFNIVLSASVAIYVILNIVIEFLNHSKNNEITNISIKEAIDKSHSGLLVLENGKIILQNSTMESLLMNVNVDNNYEESIKKAGEKLDDNIYIIFENKNVWLFEFNKNEIIANDITVEYTLNKKIENKNKKIEANNKKIIETVDKIKQIEEEKELQKIRTKFHDIFGQNISILYQYLTNKKINNIDFDDVKFMIKESFENFETTNNSKENLNNLIKANKITGTDIILDGKLPINENESKVFFEIIREAVTNAIKHAGSNQINVKITNGLIKTQMEITNNGKKTFSEIKEHEGIKGMRRKIEEIGGNIYIKPEDDFKIIVEI